MRLYPDSSWHEWPSLRITSDLKKQLEIEEIRQFLFFRQWERLKKYCSSKNILLVGDIPIYADYESADVWSHPEFFKLNKLKLPEVVSGVPPDYFSSTGQRWGNPVYRWNLLKNDGFRWWLQRIQLNFSFFDLIRLDHFRGFHEFWEIPAFDKTAVNGYWVKGPQKAFLKSITQQFHASRFIAEDLGHITPGVRQLMNEFGLPGMRLVQFAFRDDPSNHPMAPHNHIPNCVVYTGTHDNNSIRGWFEEELTERQRSTIFRYIGRKISSRSVHHEFVKLAMMSVANTAILPVQDVLGLGATSRINKPSTTDRNWRWRLRPGQLNERSIEWIGHLVAIYGR
jgi:4-alpha-glucanotransferase